MSITLQHRSVRPFSWFYPVVIDVETADLTPKPMRCPSDCRHHPEMDEQGIADAGHHHYISIVEPFVGANLQPEVLAFNGSDPNDPDRGAVSEYRGAARNFKVVRSSIKATAVTSAIMVAHNANFDHSFMMDAAERAH